MRARIKTKISGIDSMIDGGIPEGNQTLIAGGPGSGKTLLCFEFLYRCALDGDVSLFFSLEEDRDMIIQNAKDAFPDFKDIDRLLDEKKLVIMGSDLTKTFVQRDAGSAYMFGKLVTEIESQIEFYKADRIVIDSMTIARLFIKDPFEYRNTTMSLIAILRRMKVTSLITAEIDVSDKKMIRYESDFFIYDGILMLYTTGTPGEITTPVMEIIKMRGCKHSFMAQPYEITPSGISVMSLEDKK